MTAPALTESESQPRTHRVAPLLDLDTDLGQFLDAERREQARHELLVQVRRLSTGPWDAGSLTVADPGHLGLLLLDGVMSREVLASDTISTELVGPGEMLRPWELSPDAALLEVKVRWNVLAEARVAVLDRRVAGLLGAYPEITSQIVERLSRRSQRLAVNQAISQLNRVDKRLLTLFWHLAERWGRMTPDGVLIPLTLSHRMLSQLIGARRPTVSTALGELSRSGEVRRLDNGTWLLTGTPVGQPEGSGVRLVPPRRKLMPRQPEHEHAAALTEVRPPTGVPRLRTAADREAIKAKLVRLRTDSSQMSQQLRGACEISAELCRRIQTLREQRLAARGPLGP